MIFSVGFAPNLPGKSYALLPDAVNNRTLTVSLPICPGGVSQKVHENTKRRLRGSVESPRLRGDRVAAGSDVEGTTDSGAAPS